MNPYIRQLIEATSQEGVTILIPSDGRAYVDPEVDICHARYVAECEVEAIEEFRSLLREEGDAFYKTVNDWIDELSTEDLIVEERDLNE
jgi:hypothetical protein